MKHLGCLDMEDVSKCCEVFGSETIIISWGFFSCLNSKKVKPSKNLKNRLCDQRVQGANTQ